MLHHLPESLQRYLARLLFRVPAGALSVMLGERATFDGAVLDLRVQLIVALANSGAPPEARILPILVY